MKRKIFYQFFVYCLQIYLFEGVNGLLLFNGMGIYGWGYSELLFKAFRKIGGIGKAHFEGNFGDVAGFVLQQICRSRQPDPPNQFDRWFTCQRNYFSVQH